MSLAPMQLSLVCTSEIVLGTSAIALGSNMIVLDTNLDTGAAVCLDVKISLILT